MVAHVECFEAFHADLGAENTDGSGVIRFERCTGRWLFVAHFFQSCDHGDSFLGVEKETAGFGFRDAATLQIVLQRTWTAPFGFGVGGLLVAPEMLVRKKPAAQLWALGRTRYAALEQMVRIMLLAW